MNFLPPSNKENIEENTSIHILITLLEREAMFTSSNSPGSQRNPHRRTYARNQLSPLQDHTPRRRSLAIRDLLNPAGVDRRDSPAYSPPPSFNEVDEQTGQDTTRVDQPSRQTSISPSARNRRRLPASSRPSGPRERRQFRPTYLDEEVYFIWYYRIDLGYDWQDLATAYNAQFPDRTRVGFGGIQCKYYRYCEEFGIPKVRNRNRSASAVQEYGMRSRTGRSYPWMRH